MVISYYIPTLRPRSFSVLPSSFLPLPRFASCAATMGVAIRLARLGSRHRPIYRIVAADRRAPRDGKFLEKVSGGGGRDCARLKRRRVGESECVRFLASLLQPDSSLPQAAARASLFRARRQKRRLGRTKAAAIGAKGGRAEGNEEKRHMELSRLRWPLFFPPSFRLYRYCALRV